MGFPQRIAVGLLGPRQLKLDFFEVVFCGGGFFVFEFLVAIFLRVDHHLRIDFGDLCNEELLHLRCHGVFLRCPCIVLLRCYFDFFLSVHL